MKTEGHSPVLAALPVQMVGAPWIRALQGCGLKGVAFKPVEFTPGSGPYQGRVCHGIEIAVTDPDQLHAPLRGAALVQTLHAQWPASFALNKTEAILASRATSADLNNGLSATDMASRWQQDLTSFVERRQHYLLY